MHVLEVAVADFESVLAVADVLGFDDGVLLALGEGGEWVVHQAQLYPLLDLATLLRVDPGFEVLVYVLAVFLDFGEFLGWLALVLARVDALVEALRYLLVEFRTVRDA
jgi:hypothetical protein